MAYSFENNRINSNIKTGNLFKIPKMEDYYLYVLFKYTTQNWNGCIPIKSKYHGLDIPLTKDDVKNWVIKCYEELDPGKNTVWQDAQRQFWDTKDAADTQNVFEALNSTESLTRWQCRKCGPVPKCNPQPGARIKSLRQMGYFIATTLMPCATCGRQESFDLLVRLPRQAANNDKRSSLSISLQNRIKTVLPLKDACFDSPQKASELIIDHKFPSSRWVNGETVNETSMTEEEIIKKFQLLTNKTNLQKERYCQRCVLTGKRGDFFGIEWYYEGDQNWNGTSKADENGCIGCCWYDLQKWRNRFNAYLKRLDELNKK